MKGGKGSKNNIANRGSGARIKQLNGKTVIPVQFKGANLGFGNFMAAMYEDEKKLVLDANGRPIPYDSVQ